MRSRAVRGERSAGSALGINRKGVPRGGAVFGPNGHALARFAGGIRRVECGVNAVPSVGTSQRVGRAMGGVTAGRGTGSFRTVCRQHQRAGASPRSWRAKKTVRARLWAARAAA